MIELTTGIAFLVSSLYGNGNAAMQAGADALNKDLPEKATTTEDRAFMDSKSVESYVRKAYAGDPILVDIARCESTFRQFNKDGDVIRGRVNKGDVGVMQINEKYHAEDANELGYNIYTLEGNVAFGQHLYDKYGAQPWSSSAKCWTAGKELAYNK